MVDGRMPVGSGRPDEEVEVRLAERLLAELETALRRRPIHELRLAGVLRLLIPESEALREGATAALSVMLRRNTVERPLFAACLRALAEVGDPRVAPLVAQALIRKEGPDSATLVAASFLEASELREPLARLASSGVPHTAFAAEVARMARGESSPGLLEGLAPRLKEAYRIELCESLLLPLIWAGRRVRGIGPALRVLRDTERHLGRWLVLAELAHKSGERSVLDEARAARDQSQKSTRPAWSWVLWALEPDGESPDHRPGLELLARLSDRPSSERELSFLFRIASAGLPAARTGLESLVRSPVLTEPIQIRAAGHLLRDYGMPEMERRLLDVVRSAKREPLRGLALAVLFDARESDVLLADIDFSRSRQLPTAGWETLVRLATRRAKKRRVVTEPTFRRVQLGWLD